ncbi:hypothetical protein HNR46_000526 [Haloferula luteola]|uniref:PA14 domain protein n=1 Tax=Haloferula luteola TaxID=595692 RepID=A0A840UWZ9_9BACT|nr:PA14 domain-containing protein [Haloferula luteola]MBB5350302.1 hypothetical protein [Haloferula luteola]
MRPKSLPFLVAAGAGLALVGLSIHHRAPFASPSVNFSPETLAPSESGEIPFTEPVVPSIDAREAFSQIAHANKDQVISLPLPDGSTLEARLNYVRTIENGAIIAGGRLVKDGSIFQVAREPWGYRGFILQREQGIAYVYGTDENETLTVARRPLGEVICEPDPHWEPFTPTETPDLQAIPISNQGRSVGVLAEPVPLLHSLPRAKATIYLDFDGEVIEGHSWEGGARIVAPAFLLTADRIEEIWRQVSENFAPFEVNVTTDLQTYLQAPEGLRIHCISTSNNFASAGGVAFNNTFRESGSPVCWNFDPNSGAALVISHEVGHTFGLHHDGLNDQGYYGGHANWGPIMGAPYGKEVTQWSQGEYAGANQQQDDIAFIGASTPERADEAPDLIDEAVPLTLTSGGSVEQSGLIINRHDLDRYSFTTGGGTLNLQFTGAESSPNLNIEARLYHPSGNQIALSSPGDQLSASLSATLGAGTYTLTIDGVGDGGWAANRYDDYGSIGQYRITGTVPNPGWQFHVDPTALSGTTLGAVDPGAGTSYRIRSGNTDGSFSIASNTGQLSVAGPLTPGTLFLLQVQYSRNGSSIIVPVNIRVDRIHGLKYELWTGLGGSGISGLTSHSNYPNRPTQTGRAPTFQAVYPGENYGQKLSGFLIPEESGNHTFWTTADDASELWLSTDADPNHKQRIAWNTSATGQDNWTQQGTQESAPITLVAGQRYYIEFLTRENRGGDHSSAVWQTPSRARQLIPTQELEYPGIPENQAPWIASRTYRVREDQSPGSAIAVVTAGDHEPGSILSNFAIVSGNLANAFAIDPYSGELRVAGNLSFANRPSYSLRISARDSGGLSTTADIALEIVPLAVKRDLWTGISGNAVSNLTADARYPDQPTLTTYETHFETGINIDDAYGQRLTGYLRAPDTGDFTFWIASDDHGEIWLSTDTDPANRQRIAYHTGATAYRQWGLYSTQQSDPIPLEAGRFYFIEVLQKEGGGGDHLSVAWQGPQFSRTILGAPHVTQSFYNHGAPVLNDLAATAYTRDVGVTIATLTAEDWADPGTTIRYSITGGNEDGAFAIDELTGEIRLVSNSLSPGTRILSVTATDNSPTSLSDTATVTLDIRRPALKREVWTGLNSSQALTGLTTSITYPGRPNETGYTASFEAPNGWGERYGQRLSGFVTPPTTGNYTFWIASDDGGELWLSTDMNPANRRKLCQVNGSVNARDWTAQGNQQSAAIALVAGQRYYIEALQKEGTGGDHLAVAWQGPNLSQRVISGDHLEYPESFRPGLRRDLWYGADWSSFPTSRPDFSGTILDGEAPRNTGDQYLQRLTGYLIPPTTGTYRLWLSSDDDSTLSLSTSEDPADLAEMASVSGYVDPDTWNAQASQRSRAVHLVAGQRYFLEARHRDGIGGDHLSLAWQGPDWSREIIANRFLELPEAPQDRSRLLVETWTGVSGTSVSNLTNLIPSTPTSVGILPEQAGFESPSNTGDQFGRRISGYLVAPETGRYTFWIASDDQSELWMGTDANPANRILAAHVSSATSVRSWDEQAGQQSVPIGLVGGQRYYLEVLHKEGAVDDHLAVAWQGPGLTRQIISNAWLEHPDSLPGTPSLRREVWTDLPGATVSDLTNSNAFATAQPQSRGVLTSFESPQGFHDEFGERISAHLIAPESGNFQFWIAADDGSELWLSPDDDRNHRILLASTPDWTDFRQWDKFSSQASPLVPLVAGRSYFLEALHKDHQFGDHLSVSWQGPSFSQQIVDGRFLRYPGNPPPIVSLRREIWTGITGNGLSNLTNHSRFPNRPHQVESLDTFESPANWGDNYGQKISGYLIAPRSGDYTFWILSDDAGELWLSTDGNPDNKARIAWADSATGSDNWSNFASQQSATITLAAGQRCYIEGLHKEGAGDDYFTAAWQGPGFDRQILGAPHLEYPGLLPAETDPGTPAAAAPSDIGFAFWVDSKNLTGDDRLPSADPDRDGIPNALEFVFGGNPLSSSSPHPSLQPKLTLDDDTAIFTFRRAAIASASQPRVEITTRLGTWTTAVDGIGEITIDVEPDAFDTGIDRISVRVPRTSSALFLRLVSDL